MPSDRTQQARERAAEIIEALDEQDITWHSQGPWEHLGDACRDGRLMAEDALYLADRVAALETALREADEKLAECGTLLGRTANERDDLNDRLRVITVLCSYGYDLSFLDRMPLGSADEIGAYYGGELPEYVRTEIDAALAGGGGQTETPA